MRVQDLAQEHCSVNLAWVENPKGGTGSMHDMGVPTYFFVLKIYTLDIFWGGQEIYHICFQVLRFI